MSKTKILFTHPDEQFCEFVRDYLNNFNFETLISTSGIGAFGVAIKERPDLIMITKGMPNLDLKGFLIKKGVTPSIKHTALFLMGDFDSNEILDYRDPTIKAFISFPLNLQVLVDRLYQFFMRVHTPGENRMSMLMDIHAKGDILVIQLEANLDPDKLTIVNYQIRTFCRVKEIKKPKVLVIIPSMYPETITKENLDILFGFMNYPELKVQTKDVKILTTNKTFLEMLQTDPIYIEFEVVSSYYAGIESLNLDFDKEKRIPLPHLKEGSVCIFDLYDDEGDIRIPALATITKEIKEYLLGTGMKELTYYSDKEISEVIDESRQTIGAGESGEAKQQDKLTTDFNEVVLQEGLVEFINEKVNIFFKKLKEHCALVISNNSYNREIIKSCLEVYMNVDVVNSGPSLMKTIKSKKYILIFIDQYIPDHSPHELLREIRKFAGKKQISVIILTRKINMAELSQFKKEGTDSILISPFSNKKVLYKVFNALYLDRRS